MTPFRGVVDIAPEETGDGGSRQEENVFATVVAARKAGLAGMARNVGFDGDAVTGLEMLDRGVHGEDLRELVVGFAGRWQRGGGGTSPADSWPRMCLSSTIIGPIQPACQKWTSEL